MYNGLDLCLLFIVIEILFWRIPSILFVALFTAYLSTCPEINVVTQVFSVIRPVVPEHCRQGKRAILGFGTRLILTWSKAWVTSVHCLSCQELGTEAECCLTVSASFTFFQRSSPHLPHFFSPSPLLSFFHSPFCSL